MRTKTLYLIFHIILFVATSFCLSFLQACTEETLITSLDNNSNTPVTLLLNNPGIKAQDYDNLENNIHRIRIVAFKSNLSSSASGVLECNQMYQNPPDTIKQIISAGNKNIYLIINEPLNPDNSVKEEFSNILTENDLLEIKLQYKQYISEITMFKDYPSTYVKADGTTVIGENIERTIAKVKFTLNYNFSDLDRRVILDSVRIMGLPKYSYLTTGKKYIVSEEENSFSQSETVYVNNKNSIETTETFSIQDLTFYVPEYLLDNPDKHAYLDVRGHIQGTSILCAYKISIGDAMNSNITGSNRYDIKRNREYIFTGQLKGYGGAIHVEAEIKDWKLASLSDITVNQYELKVEKSEIQIGSGDLDTFFGIETDDPNGWSATVTLGSEWLSLGTTTGPTGLSKMLINTTNNDNGELRVGEIFVSIMNGLLKKKIIVKQTSLRKGYPNCYIVQPGDFIDVPVYKAYAVFEKELGILLTGNVTAELIWQDAPDLVTKITLPYGDRGKNSKIRVQTKKEVSGNAVVAVKVNGTTCWSWHIWITNYDPNTVVPGPSNGAYAVKDGNIYRYNSGYVNNVFMDRHLGATSNIVGDIRARGLLYQWGRKDPFPGSKSSIRDDSTEPIIYKMNGGIATLIKTKTASVSNLVNAINNPLTYYYYGEFPYDWYTTQASARNDKLWNNPDGSKTYYDPCPEGWRVPKAGNGTFSLTYSPWYKMGVDLVFSSAIANYGASAWKNGWYFGNPAYQLGYYPATGYRNLTNGTLYSVNYNSSVLTATSYDTDSYNTFNLHINDENVHPLAYAGKSFGSSVRCVKE